MMRKSLTEQRISQRREIAVSDQSRPTEDMQRESHQHVYQYADQDSPTAAYREQLGSRPDGHQTGRRNTITESRCI